MIYFTPNSQWSMFCFVLFFVAIVGVFLFLCKKKILASNLLSLISYFQQISHVVASDCMSLIKSELLQIKRHLYI